MSSSKGKLIVVGIGPGDKASLTSEATSALRRSDVIVGYKSYIKKVLAIFPEKHFKGYGMGKEMDRVDEAIRLAESGLAVALVSSGDAGIYGMAGPVIEKAPASLDVRVVPGLSSLSFTGALLGAPLMNDFCVLSLSDLLTPEKVVTKRLIAALEGGFVVVLYNPASSKRRALFEKAVKAINKRRPASTCCGVVRQLKDLSFDVKVIRLDELLNAVVDMNTTVFIGNEHTVVIEGRMVTKRGYENKK